MANLRDQQTIVGKFKGRLEKRSSTPTDTGVPGLPDKGQMYFDTDQNAIKIHTGSGSWKEVVLTTTSTSTSTTTTTSTTTSA